MQIPERKLIRLAEEIHQQLKGLQASRYGEVIRRARCLIENTSQLRRSNDLLMICLGRNWNVAAGKVTDQIVQGLRDLPYHAGEVQRMIESATKSLPSVRDILADLQQAQEEFEDLKYVDDDRTLVVTTEPIELEGYYLGEFEIQLRLGNLAEIKRHGSTYRIVALDPHPAASNDSVTHPHVSDEHLCEGDAGAAIESALANGRVCDFFQLVHAVLTTYNPHSPYVALDDWEGRPCHDCGYTMQGDGSNWCTSCENDFCDECSSYCRCCDETTCLGCLQTCEACDDPVCPSCITICDDCGRSICKSCRDEVLCPCVKENEENEDDNDEDNGTESGGTEPDGEKASGTQAA